MGASTSKLFYYRHPGKASFWANNTPNLLAVYFYSGRTQFAVVSLLLCMSLVVGS